MFEAARSLFLLEFERDIVLFEGFVFFWLAIYWLLKSLPEIADRIRGNSFEKLWLILSFVVGSIYSVSAFSEWEATTFLLAFSLGLCISLAFFVQTVAFCFLVTLLFMRPWELISDDDYLGLLPKLSFTLGFAQLAFEKVRHRQMHLKWNDTTIYILGFAFWAFITTIFSNNASEAQAMFLESYTRSIILFLIIQNSILSVRSYETLVGSLLITFASVASLSVYQTLTLAQWVEPGGEVRLLGIGAFENSNDIAALIALIFPFCLMRIINAFKKDDYARVFVYLLFMLPFMWCVVLAQSRGAMLGIAASIAILLFLSIQNRLFRTVAIALAILMIPAYGLLSSRDAAERAASSDNRKAFIVAGLRMGAMNPVFGVGFRQFENNFEAYTTTFVGEYGMRSAHNSWVQAFADTGIPGAFFYFAAFITSLILAIRLRVADPSALLALASYGLAHSFLSHAYVLYPYIIQALIAARYELYAPEKTDDSVT